MNPAGSASPRGAQRGCPTAPRLRHDGESPSPRKQAHDHRQTPPADKTRPAPRIHPRRSALNDPQDANRLSRLKRQWRKEWEEELRAQKKQSSDDICLSINQRLERLRNAWLGNMTKRTRALYDAYKAAEQEDEREGRSGWREELEAEDRGEEEEALWELAEEPLEDTAHAEPVEGGQGRDLPRFLTHGDAELGVPRRRRVE